VACGFRVESRCPEMLELHRVGAGSHCHINQLERLLEASIVIAANLGDDVTGFTVADKPIAYTDSHPVHERAMHA
jgi:hypothetical protein